MTITLMCREDEILALGRPSPLPMLIEIDEALPVRSVIEAFAVAGFTLKLNEGSRYPLLTKSDAPRRHCNPALRYGREIVLRNDNRIEAWPTIARAKERLKELERDGYTIGGTDTDAASFNEIVGCERVECR